MHASCTYTHMQVQAHMKALLTWDKKNPLQSIFSCSCFLFHLHYPLPASLFVSKMHVCFDSDGKQAAVAETKACY